MQKFRLISGVHNEGGKTYVSGTKNNIIESSKNLLEQNGPGRPRFELVVESFQPLEQPSEPVSEVDTIRKLSVPGLKEYAEVNEIDLGTATKRDEILNTILGELELV